jgi:hypothetical protein
MGIRWPVRRFERLKILSQRDDRFRLVVCDL